MGIYLFTANTYKRVCVLYDLPRKVDQNMLSSQYSKNIAVTKCYRLACDLMILIIT